MKKIEVKQIFKDSICIGGKASGIILRHRVEAVMTQEPIVIDFKGLDLITQGFCDEFFGPILQTNSQEAFRQIKFKNCSDGVQAVILSTAHRFLSDAQSVSGK